MNHDTFPVYGPFSELTTQRLDTIGQAHHEFQIHEIRRQIAHFVLTHPNYSYDQEALENAANRHVIPRLHTQL